MIENRSIAGWIPFYRYFTVYVGDCKSMYQTNPLRVNNLILIIGVIAICFFQQGCYYKTLRGESWSNTVEVKKNAFSDAFLVSDSEAEWILFTYYSAPSAQPILVEKISRYHWITVFEKPKKNALQCVRIEKVSESEYRILLECPQNNTSHNGTNKDFENVASTGMKESDSEMSVHASQEPL